MLLFLARRFALAVLVALTVLTFAFVLTRLAGDLAIVIAGPEARAADVEAIRRDCSGDFDRLIWMPAQPQMVTRLRMPATPFMTFHGPGTM